MSVSPVFVIANILKEKYILDWEEAKKLAFQHNDLIKYRKGKQNAYITANEIAASELLQRR